MPTLVRLPACSPAGKCELISPVAVSAVLAYSSDDTSCIVMLHGHSEEGGYHIALSQQDTVARLGITVVDRIE